MIDIALVVGEVVQVTAPKTNNIVILRVKLIKERWTRSGGTEFQAIYTPVKGFGQLVTPMSVAMVGDIIAAVCETDVSKNANTQQWEQSYVAKKFLNTSELHRKREKQ